MAYDGGKGECVRMRRSERRYRRLCLFCGNINTQLFIFSYLSPCQQQIERNAMISCNVNVCKCKWNKRLFWAFINIFALSWRLARAVSHRYGIFIMQIGIVQVLIWSNTPVLTSVRARAQHTHTHHTGVVWLLSSATWMLVSWWLVSYVFVRRELHLLNYASFAATNWAQNWLQTC